MMIENRLHFLSGLPRTGSTLLGSLLNQNPSIYVSPTSPLYGLLVLANEGFNAAASRHGFDERTIAEVIAKVQGGLEASSLQFTFDEFAIAKVVLKDLGRLLADFDIEPNQKTISDKVYRALVAAFYPPEREFSIVFDKHRGWPKHVDAIRDYVDPQPRIVCTVRPIAEILASYITLADRDPDNFIDAHLKRDGQEVTNEARAYLLWTQYLKVPYENMTIGLKMHAESLLIVEYDDLVFSPAETMQRVYEFCGTEPFAHDYEDIENTCAESKDEAWGLKNLHTIRSAIGKQSVDPLVHLPQAAIDYFSQFDLKEKSWLT